MTIRLKIALTIFVAGTLAALGVLATVVFAFQRFEHESTYHRANVFLGRVVAMYGDLEILPSKRQVRQRGTLLDFTALEFDLLLHFAQHPGHVFSRSQLLTAVWGYTHDGYEHTVTTHINRLRAKLEADPMRPELILTCLLYTSDAADD